MLVYDAPLAPVQSATVPVRNSTHVTSYQRPTLRCLITHQMIKGLMCLKKMQIIATADHNQALTVLWGKDLRASFEMFVVLYTSVSTAPGWSAVCEGSRENLRWLITDQMQIYISAFDIRVL